MSSASDSQSCLSCGTTNSYKDKYCINCGNDLHSQHRQTPVFDHPIFRNLDNRPVTTPSSLSGDTDSHPVSSDQTPYQTPVKFEERTRWTKFKELPIYLKILLPILLIPNILLVFLLVAIFEYYKFFKDGLQSENWPTALGHINSSTIKTHSSQEGTGYEPVIQYSYVISGVKYHSERIHVGSTGWAGLYGRARQMVARFRVGKTVKVYYHPQHPQQAVLIPGLQLGVTLVFLIPGIVLMIFGPIAAVYQITLWIGILDWIGTLGV